MDAASIAVIPSTLIVVVGKGNAETLPLARSLKDVGFASFCLSHCQTQIGHMRGLKPDLILLDASVADEFRRSAEAHDSLGQIPAIHIVSPDADSRAKAFAAGAVDCIVKPVVTEELLARVRTQLELRALQGQPDLRNMQFATTLENIGQGVCFFDAEQRLILSNRRYAEVYGVSPEAIRPGMTLSEIADLRYAVGACPIVSHAEYLAWCETINSRASPQNWSAELKSGKVIRIHHERTPDGGWVSTHEDVTEHRDAERQIAHLALHDQLTDLPNRTALVGSIGSIHKVVASRDETSLLGQQEAHQSGDLFRRAASGHRLKC